MGNSKYEKSKKYPGVYWYMIARRDGQGMERQYYILYRRGGRGSKQIFEPVGRASEGMTEAKANLAKAERMAGKEQCNTARRKEAEKNSIVGNGPLTFSRLWNIYSNANATAKSHKTDLYNYHNHIEKQLAKKLIVDITTADIEFIRHKMEGQGRAAQTVKHVLGQVRRVIRYGIKLGICSMPDNLHFEMPKVDNRKTENMTAEQLAAYWLALDEEPDQDAAAFLRLELLTGIRRGAMMALQWSDIDFDRDLITLRGATAKNGKTAHIPLIAAAKAILQQVDRKSPYIFPGKDGGPRKEYRRIARRVRDKAGLPKDFRPNHGLRHTFASQLASSGQVDLYTLQKLMTHDNPAMTQRYAHLADEAMKRAASVAGSIIPGKGGE